jgi:hypothetical protein
MIEPIVDGVHPTGVHASGRWRKQRLIEGLAEMLIELVTPRRLGSSDGLEQIAPRSPAGPTAQVEQRHGVGRL